MRELDLNRLVPATLIARKAFYALGRSDMYTNNYKECHTVKAYSSGSLARDNEIIKSIVKFMTDNGYSGIKGYVNFNSGREGYGGIRDSIIIRIPK